MHEKLYNIFIIGMNIEYYVRKGYKGFGGEFEEAIVPDCKYHLFFENCYGHKYDITMYDEEEIDEDNWGIITKGYIKISLLNEFPHLDYLIKKNYEPIDLTAAKKTPYLTSPYFDFSEYGNSKEHPTGYAKINFEAFEDMRNSPNENIKEKINQLRAGINNYYNKKACDYPENLRDSILDDDGLTERWLSYSDIRHRGSNNIM